MFDLAVVVVRGGGDLGTGCALRLARCGFRVLVGERSDPTVVRRTVAFAEAIFDGEAGVEELVGQLITDPDEASEAWRAGAVPVLVDPQLERASSLHPAIVVDAILAKRNLGTRLKPTAGTIALGPGFRAGVDVDAVVETNRGPNLGRVIWNGGAEPNTGTPAPVQGHAADRVLRAPAAGVVRSDRQIGEIVAEGDVVASIDNRSIRAPFGGLIRGLLRPGLSVDAGMKIGDLDPRLDPNLCFRVSDKALAVAGGVLEAAIMLVRRDAAG